MRLAFPRSGDRWLRAARRVLVLRQQLSRQAQRPTVGGEFWTKMWREAAAEVGAEFVDLGEGFSEIRRGEQRTRVRGKNVMLDDPVTLRLAGNRMVVHRLLADAGLPTPAFAAFDLGSLGTAQDFAHRQGGLCVVKPARGTGGGDGVTTHVGAGAELRRAALHASIFCPALVVEEQVPGDVYRLLYLKGRFLDAVRRRPPIVVGDGRSTLRSLIDTENRRRAQRGVGGIAIDPDSRAALARAGHSLRSVPRTGTRVSVKGVSNAGSELESESVCEEIGKDLRTEGARAAQVLGVQLAGVDVITPDPSLGLRESGGSVNEVNTTPGLQWHYHVRNPEQGVPVAVPILEELLS
ncbi:MAG: hypothetical protein HRU01_13160 [Myxococcales bacterium]|nr:hypothetical protein [Myxococcales bacterium]